MEISVFCGLAWGMLAAAVQYLHLERSAMRALRIDCDDPSKRISMTLFGSLIRLLILIGLFLVAWKSEWIRLEWSVVAFAVFHLFFIFKLGFDLRSRLSPPEGPDKT